MERFYAAVPFGDEAVPPPPLQSMPPAPPPAPAPEHVPGALPDVRFPPFFGRPDRQAQWEQLITWLQTAAPKFGQHFLRVDEVGSNRTVVDVKGDYERASAEAARLYEEVVVHVAKMPMCISNKYDTSFLYEADATSLRVVCRCIMSLITHIRETADGGETEGGDNGDVTTHRDADALEAMLEELLVACAHRRATDTTKFVRANGWPRDQTLRSELVRERRRQVAEATYRTFVENCLCRVPKLKRLSSQALLVVGGRAGVEHSDLNWIIAALDEFIRTLYHVMCASPALLSPNCYD